MPRLRVFRERWQEEGFASDVRTMLAYRPELFAAFVSAQNQCPF